MTDDDIDFLSLARRAWPFRWIVVAATCVLPIAIALVTPMLPQSYESTATVAMAPRGFSAAVVREPLTMPEYQQLANSEFVLDLLRSKVEKKGIPAASIDEGALTALLSPGKEEGKPYLRWMGLSARSSEPATAQIIANEWAAALMEAETNTADHRMAADALVEGRAKAAAKLAKVEADLDGIEDRHWRANARAEANEARKMVALLSKQHRELVLEDEIGTNAAALEEAKERIAQLEQDVTHAENTSHLTTLHPLLAEQLSRERVQHRGLQARSLVLLKQLQDVRVEVGRLHQEFSDAKLQVARRSAQQARELDPLNWAASEARKHYYELDARYNEALEVRAQDGTYIRLSRTASLPSVPQGPRFRYAVAAVPLGLLASLASVFVIALVRETQSRRRTA